MVAASIIGIFFVPAIFYAVEKWSSLQATRVRHMAGSFTRYGRLNMRSNARIKHSIAAVLSDHF